MLPPEPRSIAYSRRRKASIETTDSTTNASHCAHSGEVRPASPAETDDQRRDTQEDQVELGIDDEHFGTEQRRADDQPSPTRPSSGLRWRLDPPAPCYPGQHS